MDLPPMGPLGVVLGALLVAALVISAFWWARRRLGPYAMTRDRAMEQRAREAFMRGTADGYVPHGDLGPSPRERLRSSDADERE